MSCKRVMVVGSANMDYVLRVKKHLSDGECVMTDSQDVIAGGKGANRAVALARLGAVPIFSCCIGADPSGDYLYKLYLDEGIDCTPVVRTDKAGTGAAYIMVDTKGVNRIAVYTGANSLYGNDIIDNSLKYLEQAEILSLELEIPLESVQRLNIEAQRRGIPAVIDAGPMRMYTDTSIFKGAYLISPNQTEAESLTGIKIVTRDDVKEALKALYSIGVTYSHIKLGENGSACYDGKEFIFCPAFNTGLPVVDTTAAGDTYMAALCKSLSQKNSMEKAMHYASVAAGISVTRFGAIPSLPKASDVDKYI